MNVCGMCAISKFIVFSCSARSAHLYRIIRRSAAGSPRARRARSVKSAAQKEDEENVSRAMDVFVCGDDGDARRLCLRFTHVILIVRLCNILFSFGFKLTAVKTSCRAFQPPFSSLLSLRSPFSPLIRRSHPSPSDGGSASQNKREKTSERIKRIY